jgi:hypothetical protein
LCTKLRIQLKTTIENPLLERIQQAEYWWDGRHGGAVRLDVFSILVSTNFLILKLNQLN